MGESTPTKHCGGCGLTKPVSDFSVNRAAKDGLAYRCRDCGRRTRASRTPGQREAARIRNAKYMARQREKPDGGTSWTAARQREWLAANPGKAKAYRAAFAKRNPEAIQRYRQQDLERRKANPEIGQEHFHRRRARLLGGKVGKVDLAALWTGYCALCDEPIDDELKWPDPLSKSVDHIVPLSLGGSHSQSNLQWTHLVCNLRKGCSPP